MSDNQSGFMALMSVIIISVLLLIIAVTIGMTGIFGRFNVLDSESKERSLALAEACADTAILNLARSQPQLTPVLVGLDSCEIVSVTSQGTGNIIQTRAIINKSYTNLIVVIDSDYDIVSWREVANF